MRRGNGNCMEVMEKDRIPKAKIQSESHDAGKVDQTDLPTRVGMVKICRSRESTTESKSKRKEEKEEQEQEQEQEQEPEPEPEQEQEQGGAEFGGEEKIHGGRPSLRPTAQQNSVEAAEKPKQKGHKAKAAKEDTTTTTTTTTTKCTATEQVGENSGKLGAANQAVVAGHYTLDTKAVPGDKAVVVKDKLGAAAETVMGYAEQKLAAAKDALVDAQEKPAQYAANNKAEAQKHMQIKKSSHHKEGWKEQFDRRERHGGMPSEEEFFEGEAEEQEHQQQRISSIFRAIGETIMEIGQTTKQLLVGQYPIDQVLGRKDEVDDTD